MSYDNSNNFFETYLFAVTNAAAVLGFVRPPTHRGVRFAAVENYSIGATTAFGNVTTPAQLLIGTVGTPGKFVSGNIGTGAATGTIAINTAWGTADNDIRVATYNPQAAPSATNKGFIDLLADGDTVNVVPALRFATAVGVGSPVGAGLLVVTFRYW